MKTTFDQLRVGDKFKNKSGTWEKISAHWKRGRSWTGGQASCLSHVSCDRPPGWIASGFKREDKVELL